MITNVRMKISTRERIAEFGKKGQTYDEILNILMDEYEEVRK